jgi:catechol 2,3-dioxygenase-like lactoylglutathione lyase family enzyme
MTTRRVFVDHLTIRVADPVRSRDFYTAALAPLAVRVVEAPERDEVPLRIQAVAGSAPWAAFAASTRARTSSSRPSRRSSIGSGSPLTIDSKNSLRSW